jgi:phosphatidylethanolamine/phosphatidyl-N-methylethanolamine N-methyltransferase
MRVATAMHTDQVASAYDRWAPAYDLVFGRVFRQGRSDAIAAAERIGGRVLEVGLGTGISLPQYNRAIRLTGVDISDAMLDKARGRVRDLGLTNVEDIRVMDAEQLDFADDSFDVVVAQYVVTAVPDPEAALNEFARVVGAGGGLRGAVEKALMPITSRLGFRTEFAWERYAAWAATQPGIQLTERRPLPPLGHFSLVRFTKRTV